MAEKIDMGLDELIKFNKKNTRGRGRGRGGMRGGRGASRGSFRGNTRGTFRGRGGRGASRGRGGFVQRGGVQQRRQQNFTSPRGKKFVSPQKAQLIKKMAVPIGTTPQQQSGKIHISNLAFSVDQSDIQELFGGVGQLHKAVLHYDQNGKSLGTAEVVFKRHGDAVKSMKQYGRVPLDGRPMVIKMVGGDAPLVKSFASPNQRFQRGGQRGARGGQRGRGNARGGQQNGFVKSQRGGQRGAGRGARGGRGRGRGRGSFTKNPSKTVEELDKELDAYNMDTSA